MKAIVAMSLRRLASYLDRLLTAGELAADAAPRVAVPLRVANAAGAVAATIGVLVLTGWYARAPRLMQVHPSTSAVPSLPPPGGTGVRVVK